MIDYEISGNKVIVDGKHEFDFVEYTTDQGLPVVAYNQWFHRDALPIWQKHGVLEKFGNRVDWYLEVGVNCGSSFLWVMENLVTETGIGTAIDPYTHHKPRNRAGLKLAEHWFHKNLRPFRDRVDFNAVSSVDYFRDSTVRDALDLVYIDGCHDAATTLRDLIGAFDMLKRGGVVIIDDYNRQFSHGKKQTRSAVNAFWECFSHRLEPFFVTQRQAAYLKH